MTWRRSVGIAAVVAVGISAASLAQERFDYQVRGDMFRAFGGNEAAFKNAMSIIDAKLREDPDHAEALVWRGLPATGGRGSRSALATRPTPEFWLMPRWPTWIGRSRCNQAISRF